MKCFDCADLGIDCEAVAVCTDCGAGLCIDHAHVARRWLTRTMVINRTVIVEPAARSIYCPTCRAARVALGDFDTTGETTVRR
jgi:hypothetical protein